MQRAARILYPIVLIGVLIGAAPAPDARAGETLYCEQCGQPISGAYFETLGHYYHPEHFLCTHCREPINGPYTSYRGGNYHKRCFEDHVALRCAVCGGVIQGQYIVDHWGNGYHMYHKGEVEECDFCMRFMTPDLAQGAVRFSDGRVLCRICHATSIKKLADARAIMGEVANHLRRFGLDIDTDDVRLHLTGHKKMQELVEKNAHGLRGFTDYQEEKNFFGVTRHRQVDVYVLYGSPRVEMFATLAHELTHVWQFFNGRLQSDPVLLEGSCNYASYLVMRKVGTPEAEFVMQRLIEDNDPVYGDGFRRVKRYAEENGLASWLDLLRKNRDLPQYSQR